MGSYVCYGLMGSCVGRNGKVVVQLDRYGM